MKSTLLGGTALLCALAGTAAADDAAPTFTLEPAHLLPEGGSSKLTYLVDGGMVPFFWVPLAGRLALDRWVAPRDTPMMFSASEGGAPQASWEIPGAAVSATAVGLGLAMIAGGDESRWYHVKGLGETLMTGVFITGGLKDLFGRHRPDWSPTNDSRDERRSFPSGHSAQAFAIATYASLYLHDHVFDTRRGDAVLPWWEVATYAGIGLAATAIAGERVIHDRHNLSDVAIGGGLGIATSVLFYRYQEYRFQKHRSKESLQHFVIAPAVTKESKTVGLSFDW
jgi:membrane-associated phospholipid phosphatase